jgi:hypothetical protein
VDAVAEARPLEVAPMKIVGRDGSRVILELRADGAIVDSRGGPLGNIAGATVTFDEYSRPLWTIDGAGNVTCPLLDGRGRFDGDDALVFESSGKRERMSVDDDGTIVVDDGPGNTRSPPLRVSGVTGASRRAALLLALSVLVLEREGPPPRPRTVTLTLDVPQLGTPYFDLTSELRLARRWSLAMKAGGGAWTLDVVGRGASTAALELGIEPRWFVLGGFSTGLYLGWSTRFARAVHGPVGFEGLHTPPGLSTGLVVGFKSADVPIITPDVSFGLLAPLVTPGNEVSHPPVSLVVRFGVGFSF